MLEFLLKQLGKIGINIPKLNLKAKGIKITGIKFSSLINIDRSIHIDGSNIVVNPEKLSGKQRRALEKMLPGFLEASGAIIDESSEPTVESVLQSLPTIEEISKKIIPIIPPTDVPLLNASIFLRLKFERGEAIEVLKGQIMRVYGTRGCNFANLCSAGYLEKEFIPVYEELTRTYPDNPAEARSRFLSFYKTVVNELPWTEFVSGRMSAEKRTAHIVEKMNRNVVNGVRSLNIHALGAKNVKTVVSILPDIQKQTGAQTVRLENDKERIFVRLEIPTQISK
jgi:hypothetical protein